MKPTLDPRSTSAGGTPEERHLIEAFLHGDRQATAQVSDWVTRVVRHRAWRLDRGDDLTQDVLLKLITALSQDRFQGRSSLKTFVERVAKYTCLDAVRRERRATLVDLEETAEPQLVSDDDVLQELESQDLARLCYAVLSQLPEPCRQLLRRVLSEESRYEDLAAELGVATGTVKSRIARCRERAQRLRARLMQRPATWRRQESR